MDFVGGVCFGVHLVVGRGIFCAFGKVGVGLLFGCMLVLECGICGALVIVVSGLFRVREVWRVLGSISGNVEFTALG